MIPIVERWARNVEVPIQQLMMHVSFASILGGTCTLIGTSTNIIVAGLLAARFPDDPELRVGFFELGLYGVPDALVGILYIIVGSKWLLPGGRGKESGAGSAILDREDILMGAKLMPWSPAAGRSVKRSGLRNTGGIYLVSVYRAATGNVHRAVGQDFVLNVGDVLYFTGLIEGFGDFCEEHGLVVLTTDHWSN
jgi:di/tricarboxylate transporter